MTKLIECVENVSTVGIFNALSDLDVPWNTNAELLNFEYYYNNSGQKPISNLVKAKLTNGKLDSSANTFLANIAYSRFGEQWRKLYNTLIIEYNPLENYDATETKTVTEELSRERDITTVGSNTNTESGTNTDQNVVNYTDTKIGSNSRADGGTQITETESSSLGENNSEDNNKIFAFNSSEAQNKDIMIKDGDTKLNVSSSDTVTNDLTRSETINETYTKGGNGTLTKNVNVTNSGSNNDKRDDDTVEHNVITHSYNKSGMVAYTTYQEMIMSEREVWKFDFFQKVYSDIDKILTLPIYSVESI